jgi:hypothetical protein
VSSAWLTAGIQEFEQVTLDNGTELFRVRARARRGDDPEPRPVLVTREQDGVSNTYEPLSSGGDRRGQLRLAYAVPTELVGPSTSFSLQLPDGYRIELPEPTPGESRADTEDGQWLEDGEPGWDERDAPAAGDDAARRIVELEQERGELRASNDELWRRLADLTAEHDAARQAAESAQSERDEVLEATREDRAEHARLTGRLRQLQARTELLRADAARGQPGTNPRLRRLESEREQLANHVRALARLLATDVRAGDLDAATEPARPVADDAADRLETLRARAVREANEQAERELRRLRAGTPL